MKRCIKLNVFGDDEESKIQHIGGVSDQTSVVFNDNGGGKGSITITLHVASGLETLKTGSSIVDPNSLCVEVNETNTVTLINAASPIVQLSGDGQHTTFLRLKFAFNGKMASTLGKTEGSTLEDL